ncbi:hypothetical protein CLV56_3197 [Mumia flava]|uniref:Uncharacterized protein n=1 Tax=Mumia flava TaxID=1348852 RepID=A0A0B2BDS0_9ACTN|nr:hypothetical protein [Mumia flava]PJJ53705.1 hypothetical protein CLV56_3197 [Mumia flava]
MPRIRGAVVLMRVEHHRAFVESFGTGPTASTDPEDPATHTILRTDEWRLDLTERRVPHGAVATLTQHDDAAPGGFVTPVRVVLLEDDDHRFGGDVVTAAGIPVEHALDPFTKLPLAPGWQDPNAPEQMGPAFEEFARSLFPTPLVLARTDDVKSSRLTALAGAIPKPFSSAVSLLAIGPAVADAAASALAEHGLALPSREGAVLIVGHEGTLTEHHRLTRRSPVGALTSAASALLGDIADRMGLAGVGLVDENETVVRTLRAKLAEADATTTRLRAELAREQAANRRAQREVRRLAHEAGRRASPPEAPDPTPASDAPRPAGETAPEPQPEPTDPWADLPACHAETFADMLDQARAELPMVVIDDAVTKLVVPLEDQAKSSIWRRRAWLTLALLDAYARARADDDGAATFRAWIEQTPHPEIRPEHVRSGETKQMRSGRRYRDARTFSVPKEVDPSGRALFLTHVHIETGRTDPSPRLHFLDDTGRDGTGLVYVGHLGPHLLTRRTN